MTPSKQSMYRMPWSLNDNPIGWLEVTDTCNLACRGCYRLQATGHKPLEQLKEEVDFLQKWRNCDNISIAGGEPLIHPQILDIIAYIYERGMKPLVLTNGLVLKDNMPLLKDLKRAGTVGFTFHIDSEQNRPHHKKDTEVDLCELRLEYAKMVKQVGGMFCSFGATVYPGTLHLVPEIVKWANEHIDLVHGLVFITFRAAPMDGTFKYVVEGKPIEVEVSYTAPTDVEAHTTSADVYAKIKETNPLYETSAYLGGTQTHDAIKWLVAVQFGVKGKMLGSLGARGMELTQAFYHLFARHYLAYTAMHKLPKIALLAGLFDKGLGQTHGNFWKAILRNPLRLFQPIYSQSIGVIQAPDILADGRQDMCDSCPDVAVWDGKLVHSCRLDEWRLYGNYITAQPQGQPVVIQPDKIEVRSLN